MIVLMTPLLPYAKLSTSLKNESIDIRLSDEMVPVQVPKYLDV